jgi:hypothetical protein
VFLKSSQVTLRWQTPTGYSFINWSGDCVGGWCLLNMNVDHTVTANFTSVPTLNHSMDCVFNWVEKTYPQEYYPATLSQEINGYYVRHYLGSNNWLALKLSDSHVYSVDSNGFMYDYGGVATYLDASGCK